MTYFMNSFNLFLATASDYFKYSEQELQMHVKNAVIITAVISIMVSCVLFELVSFLINRRKHNVFFGDYNVVTVRHNKIVPLPHPEKDGYTFCGWYRDEQLKKRFLPTETVTQDLYLYPKWEKNHDS